jgi:uncharacterized membrane protein YgcG
MKQPLNPPDFGDVKSSIQHEGQFPTFSNNYLGPFYNYLAIFTSFHFITTLPFLSHSITLSNTFSNNYLSPFYNYLAIFTSLYYPLEHEYENLQIFVTLQLGGGARGAARVGGGQQGGDGRGRTGRGGASTSEGGDGCIMHR